MNSNLQQIFTHYIEKFDFLEGKGGHEENYKWGIAKKFRQLMDDALQKDGVEFANALNAAKKVTKNIIDSYTQPFNGLVEYAKQEPETVKQLFLNLYADDGGDLALQEKLMENFFLQSERLREKYYPGSYRYKQNSHSLSSYLFLYDPDHHYMYKATQASIFADCMGFYDDWGSGDLIRLDVFYRMCDLLVEEILQTKELLEVDALRYDGRFGTDQIDMIEDTNKHMLAFDIIYCCSRYNLFHGIKFDRPSKQEKQEYVSNSIKAEACLEKYMAAEKELETLVEGQGFLEEMFVPGTGVKHKTFGIGKVVSFDEKNLKVQFESCGEKVLATAVVIGNKLLVAETDGYQSCIDKYGDVLRRAASIHSAVERAKKDLSVYEEYLD